MNIPEKLNRYTCRACGGSIITVDRKAGVTPMLLSCRVMPGCTGTMVSAMYQNVEGEPAYEWYKPTVREYRRLSAGEQQHVALGGLLLRKIPEATHAR